jgi:hypothetical protein
MSENGTEPTHQIIGVRKNGERIVIASHCIKEVADKVVKLLSGSEFKDVHVEEKKPRKPKR